MFTYKYSRTARVPGTWVGYDMYLEELWKTYAVMAARTYVKHEIPHYNLHPHHNMQTK